MEMGVTSCGIIMRLCQQNVSGPTWGQLWSTASNVEETVPTHPKVPSKDKFCPHRTQLS